MKSKYCKHCKEETQYRYSDTGETYCKKCKNVHYNWLSGNKKYVVIALIVIALIFVIKWAIPEPNSNPNNFSNETIACLSQQYKFYGEEWCPHCQNQKESLGQVIVDVSYVDCGKNRANCEGKGITGYPFNVMFHKDTGKLTYNAGELPIKEILKYTGCE